MAWALLAAGFLLGLAWGVLHLWIVPRIDEFRPALERLAQQRMGIPIRIGQLSAQSTGWAPSFELRDIVLQGPHGETALHLPKITVAISVRSVLGLKLEQLILDQAELDIRRTRTGQWLVAGLALSQTPQGDSAAVDWLLSQREIVIRGGILHWTDERPSPPKNPAVAPDAPSTLTLTDVDLIVRNTARQHALRLDATPPANWGERFVSTGRFRRDLLSSHPGRWRDWSGQLYAYFPQVDVGQLHAHLPTKLQVMQGHGPLRLWSDIQKGEWAGGVADVQLGAVKIQHRSQDTPLTFERLAGRLALRTSDTQLKISTQGLSFVTGHGLVWPGGNVALEYTHPHGKNPANGYLQADHLDLTALQEVAMQLPLPDRLHQGLQAQSISGQVQTLQLRWQGDWSAPRHYSLQTTLQALSVHPTATDPLASPGIQNAQVKLDMSPSGGQVQMDMNKTGALFMPGVFDEALVPVKQLQAQARWQQNQGQWRVPEWKLQFANEDLQGQWQGAWQSTPQGPGKLDLQGVIQHVNAARAHRYLPSAMSAPVRQYLRDALVSGHYENVQVKIKGDLNKLPFANPKDGEFRFAGRLRDVEFDYIPQNNPSPKNLPWPRLYKLQGQLVFDRLGMKLSDGSATAGHPKTGPTLSGIQAQIPDMAHDATLGVTTDIKGLASAYLALLQKSALDPLLSGALRDTQATGTLQTRLKLNVPLQAAHKTKVQGTLQLSGNNIRLWPTTPWIEKAQGPLQFSESGFDLQGVQARLLGGAVRMDGGLRFAPANASDAHMQLRLQGQITTEGLRNAKEVSGLDTLAQHTSGGTHYTASIGWRQGQAEWTLNSTLEGMALQLPQPLGKTAAEAMPLSLRTRLQGSGSTLRDMLDIEWGRVASAHYLRDLSGSSPKVLRGHIALGTPNSSVLPDSGVLATIALDHLAVDDWQQLSTPTTGVPTMDGLWKEYGPSHIGLHANTLTADGRTLHQVVVGSTRDDLTWRANVDARELSGHLEFRQSTENQPGKLYARLARLNLPPSSAADVEALLEAPPTNLPALDIVVEQLELRGKKLGRVEIEAVNSEVTRSRVRTGGEAAREWQLNKFNLTVPEATFRSTGRWLIAREGSVLRQTEIQFRLDVSNAGQLLTRLGTPDALRGGTGVLEGRIQWQGSPLALHHPSLSGQLVVKMGKGQFLKADPGAAKLLGVLSLQALPRRLLLDFRDVFYEGFAFDSVQGDVTIAQGIAQTRNMQIKGVNAVVQLEGSADIAQETQKLRVAILPELDAGGASLIAGIAVNPLVGLTAFLTQLFLKNPLARASAQEFVIDGSWTEPRVTRIDNKTAPAPQPAASTP